METRNTFWILVAIMFVAIFARVCNLGSIPPGLWPDEALNGNQALDEPLRLFYPENNGREGLIMALDKLSFSNFGVSMFAFRLVPAIIGILTVLGIYLLASEIFKKKNIGLLAALFTATSFWHINFSRINFRAIMLPLVLCYAFYFLFLGWRKKNLWPYILSGIIFGIGFYTYTSFRLAPAILFAWMAIAGLAAKKAGEIKKFISSSLAMILAVFFTALPIGLYFLMGHMDQFFTRLDGISIFSQPNPLLAFAESLGRHLAMFNIYGDPNMRHNYSGDPQLFLPVGLFFLIGFWQTIKNTFINLKNRNWENLLGYLTLIVWFGIMLLPGVLTYEGMPHALRVIGVLPVCYILAAYGSNYLYNRLSLSMNEKLLNILTAIVLIISSIFPIYRYFFQWPQNPETKNAFSKDLVAMGEFLKDTPESYRKYVIIYGGDLPMQTVNLISRQNRQNNNINYIYPKDIPSIKPGKQTLILFMSNNQNDLEKLKKQLPGGIISSDNESGAWVYYIND